MSITQPRWKIPEYSQRQINEAGRIVRDSNTDEEEKAMALTIIDNWRASHAYPLHVFYMNLRRKAQTRVDILVAERMKRMDSIIGKLQREKGMLLYRIQDLGGCRIVLPTIQEVYSYSRQFQHSKIRHELKRTYDYIEQPKISGYRSLHLVYRFKSDRVGKDDYNRYQMLVELQFRTHLQHIWATAVETIGLFTNQALKAGEGDERTKRFFVVVSSLFALREHCPVVPGTSMNQKALISEIKQINDNHHVLEMLQAIRTVIDHDVDNIPDKRGYYILQLNYKKRTLRRQFYKPSEIEEANAQYDFLESQRGNMPLDIVLIRASSFAGVKAAYPNYFLDIGKFVDLVTEYLK